MPFRLRAVTGLFVVLLVAVTACGSGQEAPAPEASGGGAFPVTVPGKLGAAVVPRAPQRVVAMDWTSADIALALGVVPVAMQRVRIGAPTGVQPWAQPRLNGAAPTLFGTDGGDPIEQVAAARPDLIVAAKDYNLTRSHAALSQIAPVVHFRDAPNSDSWQDTTRSVATALGKQTEGDRLIADTEARIARAGTDNPQIRGKSVTFLVAPQAEAVYAVNSTTDVSARFLTGLGLTLNPALNGLPDSTIPGRTLLSYERIGSADADVVLVTGPASSIALIKGVEGYTALPAVREGRSVDLDPTAAQAIAFPSPISLQWAAEEVVPRIARAVVAR
ncbi:iron complex transport system substrate-binding protein [Pseudonocardia sediminis]|uniref:Iron complex transport system substrate-binding protein n=1 Tax=Pseudonocardia sediminis TaxID=1397368 RepID=A0A4Q7UWB5_PSEST|nr:iron-siderophore ABC transporter substrate-binding protein [Pseudonocardia sediminis]RZT84453.1 iron complex transport system substrate-binding protein [Pseudonocardia sediminis]